MEPFSCERKSDYFHQNIIGRVHIKCETLVYMLAEYAYQMRKFCLYVSRVCMPNANFIYMLAEYSCQMRRFFISAETIVFKPAGYSCQMRNYCLYVNRVCICMPKAKLLFICLPVRGFD